MLQAAATAPLLPRKVTCAEIILEPEKVIRVLLGSLSTHTLREAQQPGADDCELPKRRSGKVLSPSG
tara:strand:- start:20 stop:220 length:201 start_codon:yes stop_codon:yes gene_type:complete